MHFIDYVRFVRQAAADRALMTRIALNILYDSDAYPVDLSEVRGLNGQNLTNTHAFLNYQFVRLTKCSDEYGEQLVGDLDRLRGESTA